jgi:hypothetical protein
MSLLPLGLLSQGGGGGAAGSFELISTSLLSTTTASVTFSSLPATYKHLQFRIAGRFTAAAFQNTVTLRFNGDSATNYATHFLRGNGSSVSSGNSTTVAQITAGYLPSASETANLYGGMVIDILDFNSTAKNKTIRSFSGRTFGTSAWLELTSGLWASTAAVTSILVSDVIGSGSFAAGTRISLYGIKDT